MDTEKLKPKIETKDWLIVHQAEKKFTPNSTITMVCIRRFIAWVTKISIFKIEEIPMDMSHRLYIVLRQAKIGTFPTIFIRGTKFFAPHV